MNTHTETRIITENGKPTFAIIPWNEFELVRSIIERNRKLRDGIPHAVIERVALDGIHPARAWREHLGFDQSSIAIKAGMKQSSLARIESGDSNTRTSTLKRLSEALGLQLDQIDIT